MSRVNVVCVDLDFHDLWDGREKMVRKKQSQNACPFNPFPATGRVLLAPLLAICPEERLSKPGTFILTNRLHMRMHEQSDFKQDGML